ncbi:mitochondrial inheritance component mdm12 [Cordyceps fumosorosea ARSEF 2679]|uniref:Mitochondrial distribution and morphology protein 12 n=1 Tax=Cordyceps fumosorosea (strain ARSEF 2679) TaxID=1081104 RepID=A0A167V3H0_CORFA|nr:mitochondrial inheritance component mdm12 [Cordyceps fumosorosea ARSEF 2679]OAA62194.1 mitochondrial inheritance component mdm12 [Cordyceps fumosorosea ARSEF 2679]
MSIELNWETLTSGPDGEALAESIRGFIHDKFQSVPLPRFIKSVTVHGFDFGSIAPELELKDIADPLPDFYEQPLEDDESDEDEEEEEEADEQLHQHHPYPHHHHAASRGQAPPGRSNRPSDLKTAIRNEFSHHHHDLTSPFMGTSTPGLLGGPGLSYHLHGHLGTGTQTPLAAVAGAHLGSSWLGHGYDSASAAEATAAEAAGVRMPEPSHSRNPSQSSILSVDNLGFLPPPQPAALQALSSRGLREKSSVSTLAPTSIGTSRPPTRDAHADSAIIDSDYDDANDGGGGRADDDDAARTAPLPPRRREPRVEDVQAVFRIRYAGDVRLNLTAEILLDYPMPSFVGIPLKLNITGLSFDGVGVLAHIRKRVHFCFLSPDDALTAVGGPEDGGGGSRPGSMRSGAAAEMEAEGGAGRGGGGGGGGSTRFGGLLQEIRVESEIGGREGGKQSLKNVGKVEKFVLEQVRRIFEEEFVYPSFWTFLV